MITTFSDYIVYVDESGDHSLLSIDTEYPIFVLSFCIFRKGEYAQAMTPAVRRLKLETFGHDMAILHEIDIRKKKGVFSKLGKEAREHFLNALTNIIEAADFRLVAVVIDKRKLKAKYANPEHPYHLAMEFGLERIYRYLKNMAQDDRLTHLVCEAQRKTPNWNWSFAVSGMAGISSTNPCHLSWWWRTRKPIQRECSLRI